MKNENGSKEKENGILNKERKQWRKWTGWKLRGDNNLNCL